jgi:hypothetical protein
MPARPRALRICSVGSTRRCSRKVFYPRYGTGSIMRSPAFAASGKKPRRNARVPEHQEAAAAEAAVLEVAAVPAAALVAVAAAGRTAIEDWIGK